MTADDRFLPDMLTTLDDLIPRRLPPDALTDLDDLIPTDEPANP